MSASDRKPVTGLQNFILDPKSSVKKYINDSLSTDNENTNSDSTPKFGGNWHQSAPSNNFHGNTLAPSYSQPLQPTNGQRPSSSSSNQGFNTQTYQQPQPQHFGGNSNADLPIRPLAQEPQNYGPPIAQPQPQSYTSFTPPPAIKNDFQNLKQDIKNMASNISQGPPQNNSYPPAQQQYNPYGAPSGTPPISGHVGPAPPPPDMIQTAVALPASRLYHRMISEYETIQAIFYSAKMQPVHNDLAPIASKLKTLCRDIWTLRYSRASEFAYNDTATEERITEWKAQFEYWTDILQDLSDPMYVKMQQLVDQESNWAELAGLNLSDAEEAAPAAAAVVKKKVVKKVAAAAEEDDAPAPVKKKVVKKKVAAA